MHQSTPKKISDVTILAVTSIVIVCLICFTLVINSFITSKADTSFSCEVTNIEYDQANCYYNNTVTALEYLASIEKNSDGSIIKTYNLKHMDCIKPHNIKCSGSLTVDMAQLIKTLDEASKR